jgi:hypothetical protein
LPHRFFTSSRPDHGQDDRHVHPRHHQPERIGYVNDRRWLKSCDAVDQISKQFETVSAQETKRVKELNPSGTDYGAASKIINADPQIIAFGKQPDALGAQMMTLRAQKAKLRAKLTATKKAGNAKLDQFNTYVAKKKAAWTLGSKKSVPAAEAFIKSMRVVVAGSHR